MEYKKFLTLAEVASEFGLDEAALQQFVDSGEVQPLADRGTWKYRHDELQMLIDSGKIAPPTADLWLDEGALPTEQVLTVGTEADDDLSYIELDEEALAEHATMISKSSPFENRTPVDEVPVAEDWFVPSNVDEMQPPTNDSDVRPAVRASASDSVFDLDEPSWKSDSDSDVGIAADVSGGMLEGSEIVLDFDPGVGSTVSSSGSSLRLPQTGAGDDSTSAWEEAEEERGVSTGDSGISLADASDSGSGDSSIRLSDDSGLSLEAADSGLTLDASGDSGISLSSLDKTLADDDFAASMLDDDVSGKTQTLDLSSQFDDDSSFDMNLSDTGATAEINIGDEDDFEETAATVVKKGRGKEGPGLTGAFQLDDAPEVEDLDIADDLNASSDDDDEVAELEDEEVIDASDDTFGEEVETADDDEEYLAAAGAAAKTVGPREPSWGTGMSVGLIACSLILAANGLILWSGVSTMWNGADASGPAASLIAQLAGLINS